MLKQTTFFERLGFSSFIGGQKILYILISSYATIFFISELKLNIVFVSLLVLSTRIFDAINDPIIGALIDKSSIKLKTYLNLTTVLLPLITVLMFVIKFSNDSIVPHIYITVIYVVWSILYTISEVPIYAIVSRMTNNVDEQNSIFSKSLLGSVIGSLLSTALIAYFIANGVDFINWDLMALSLGLLGFFQMAIAVFFIKERYPVDSTSKPQSITEGLISVLKNKQLVIIMVIFMSQLFVNASSVLAIYVYDAYYNMTSLGSITSIVSLFAIIPLAFSLTFLISKIGKTWLIYVASGILIFSNLAILILGGSRLGELLVPVLLILSTFGLVIPSLLRPLYTQEVIEYYKKKGGKINTAASFSVMTLFNKAGDALGAGLGTLLLIVVGFNENIPVEQLESSVVSNMRLLWILGPILMGLCWFIGIKYFYKLKHVKKLDFSIDPEVAIEYDKVGK